MAGPYRDLQVGAATVHETTVWRDVDVLGQHRCAVSAELAHAETQIAPLSCNRLLETAAVIPQSHWSAVAC